ncbi:MAG: sulfite exporter TauE/SafE family protein, partial [Acidobacteriota bacterium]
LRLPYLVGTLRLSLKTAIPINLTVSLATLLAALPARLYTLDTKSMKPFLYETTALAVGAVMGAYVGVSSLGQVSAISLRRAVFAILLVLGLVMIAESALQITPIGILREPFVFRIISGLALGTVIGGVSGLLGVAGGEIVIPTFILGFSAPIKSAGSLSQMVSIPTVLTGVIRHYRAGNLADRQILTRIILPMSAGAIAGGIAGGLLSGLVPAALLKALLGIILITSSIKVFRRTKSEDGLITA